MEDDKRLAEKINSLLPLLNEEQKRVYLATETIYFRQRRQSKTGEVDRRIPQHDKQGLKRAEGWSAYRFHWQD